jgi:hypothetical protein
MSDLLREVKGHCAATIRSLVPRFSLVLERYEMSRFLEFRNQLSPKQFAMETQLGILMKQAECRRTSHLGDEWPEQITVPFYMNFERPTVANVGRILVDFDLEIRRTTSYQLSTSMALTKSSQYMEVIHTTNNDVLQIVLALSNELRRALTSQPIAFLITLDWLWDFRYSKSRVRSPIGRRNPHERWRHIFESVSECAATLQPIAAEIAIGHHDSTTFGFRTERGDASLGEFQKTEVR